MSPHTDLLLNQGRHKRLQHLPQRQHHDEMYYYWCVFRAVGGSAHHSTKLLLHCRTHED